MLILFAYVILLHTPVFLLITYSLRMACNETKYVVLSIVLINEIILPKLKFFSLLNW